MAKLRHLALSVKDLEASAKFYEDAFGMERIRQSKVAIMLSDGVVSLALLHLRSNDNAPDERGPIPRTRSGYGTKCPCLHS